MSSRLRGSACALVVGWALALTRPALAQSTVRNPVAAQALYEDGRRLVQAGRYDEACPKLKESYQLDPGGGTMLNLADCYEKQGKLALAWSTFKDALARAQRDGREDRAEFATQHLSALERRLPRLSVDVPAGARVPGMTITVDGVPLGEAAWGVAMPIDPGAHAVRAEAAGKQPFVVTLDTPASAARQRVEVPVLADLGSRDSLNGPVPRAVDAGDLTESPRGGGAQRAVGWTLGGLGAASVGVASYFGLRAFARWNDRDADCVSGCSELAREAGDDARQAATLSTVGFAAGLALVAGGAYLVLSGRGERARAAPDPATLVLTPLAFTRGVGLSLGSAW